ncbi:MAG: ATP-binding cassette domain-containing protein, partial [Desulfovibrionaceae bacterium]|nr:ATP-binding cassette domain-containing protein [Desulfovibrionaceae bacterium]
HKNALLVEMVNGLETLKCCMAESRMQRLWEAVVGNSAAASADARRYNNLAVGISMLVTQLVTVIMVIWGVYRIGDGLMTMGGLIGSNILVGRAMAPLLQMASLLTRLQNSRVSLKALDMLMELPSENQDEKALLDFGNLEASFSMEDVSFAYPGAERTALADVNLRIRRGEKVGIVGRMGSGKSTLGKLLIGLYQPAQGAVKFGGVDIRQLAGADLRSRVGFLPQDVVLFYGTLRDNIVLGDPTINDHLVLRASALAGVTDFVRNNPAGFGAQVGEQGKNLSGGQRQAVALARALVRDPEVLILDEPTSNMDNASERMVQRRLRSILEGKTLVLITHRLSMLDIVDRLVVMDGGRIVLDGPRDEVLRRLRGRPADDPAAGKKVAPRAGNAAGQP